MYGASPDALLGASVFLPLSIHLELLPVVELDVI